MKPKPIEIQIGEILRRRDWRLATAESCTGGLIGHKITNIPGCSDYYLGGVIAYANEVKINQLGVSAETLEKHGAVSQETVIEMARGVCERYHAEVGLSVSGIAGPGGGTQEKPIGLIWIGLSTPVIEASWQYTWRGNRQEIKEQAADQALRLLVEALKQFL
jgi:PncC family amidohydrolase